jgi:hypothetical protein
MKEIVMNKEQMSIVMALKDNLKDESNYKKLKNLLVELSNNTPNNYDYALILRDIVKEIK